MPSPRLDASSVVHSRSPSRSLPDTVIRAFSSSLTTTVFSQRSMRRFDTSPRRAAPKGQTFISCTAPRSITQLPSNLPRSWHTPVAEGSLVHVDLTGDFGDRTRRLDHHLHGLALELGRKLPSPFRHCYPSIQTEPYRVRGPESARLPSPLSRQQSGRCRTV